MIRFLPFWFRAVVGCALVHCAGAVFAFSLDTDTSLTLYRWDRWSGDDLPARSVRAVVYGNDGYIWSPSYGGLIRFDGQRFEALNPPEGFGTITNGFTAASPGSDAGLWLGGTGGASTGLSMVRSPVCSSRLIRGSTPSFPSSTTVAAGSGSVGPRGWFD